jgi:hypothetical protein
VFVINFRFGKEGDCFVATPITDLNGVALNRAHYLRITAVGAGEGVGRRCAATGYEVMKISITL